MTLNGHILLINLILTRLKQICCFRSLVKPFGFNVEISGMVCAFTFDANIKITQ